MKARWFSKAIKSFAMSELEARKLKYLTTGTEALLMGVLIEVMAGKLPLHTYFLAFGLKWILLVTRFCLLLALMMKKLKSLSPQFLNLDVRMIDVCFNMYEQEFCFNCILAIDAIVCTIDRSTGCLFRLLIWMHKSSFQI